jgi:transcriptional regulator with XRE-family HTH domain
MPIPEYLLPEQGKATPQRIKRMREQMGLTVFELGVVLQSSVLSIEKWESGKAEISAPTWQLLLLKFALHNDFNRRALVRRKQKLRDDDRRFKESRGEPKQLEPTHT